MKRTCIAVALMCGAGAAQAGNSVKLSGAIEPNEPQSALFTLTQSQARDEYLECEEMVDDEGLAVTTPDLMRVQAAVVSGSQQLVVRGLKADTHYKCKADGDHPSNSVNLWTEPLPADLLTPDITVLDLEPSEVGYTLYNSGDLVIDQSVQPPTYPNDNNYLVILDAEGNVRWYYGGPGTGDIDASYLGAQGILFAGQHDATPGNPDNFYPPTLVSLGKQATFPVAASLPATLPPISGATELPGSYNHDVGVSVDGSSIYSMTYTSKTNSSGVTQQGFMIRAVNRSSNAVVWAWDSFAAVANGQLAAVNPLAPTTPTGPGIKAFVADPWHPNTIWEANEVVDPSSGATKRFVYVSLRNLSTVLKIARDNDGTPAPGAPVPLFKQSPVVWRMGAFARVPNSYIYVAPTSTTPARCVPNTSTASTWPLEFNLVSATDTALPLTQWFFDQHDIKFNGSVATLYDNGTERAAFGAAPYSRLVKLQVVSAPVNSPPVINQATTPPTCVATAVAGKVRLTWQYAEWNGDATDPANWSEPFWGGYDPLASGRILVAQGHCSFCEVPAGQGGTSSPPSHNSTLMDLDPATNTPVWKAVFPDASTMVYRAERIDGCAIFSNLTYCPTLAE